MFKQITINNHFLSLTVPARGRQRTGKSISNLLPINAFALKSFKTPIKPFFGN